MDVKKLFHDIKKSHSPERMNDFLIELGEHPDQGNWEMIDFFITQLNKKLFEKIKINLVYVIGAFSSKEIFPKKFLTFLVDIYYQSDRWVRNEIIKTFINIIEEQQVNKKIIDVLETSIKEEYSPLKKNALEAISKLENLEPSLIRNIMMIMDNRDSEVLDKCKKILKKEIKNEQQLFEILNYDKSYTFINKRAFRVILTYFFKSAINIEPFRERIENSNWETKYKHKYLKEIDTFQKILLKNL